MERVAYSVYEPSRPTDQWNVRQ